MNDTNLAFIAAALQVANEYGKHCTECGEPTDRYDAENEDWCCESCAEELERGQIEDMRLDGRL